MKVNSLDMMTKGWFVGNFEPCVLKTDKVEIAVKTYSKGDHEPKHLHKIATEITVITQGKVRMNGTVYTKGDIITIMPGEATDFFALEDTETTVVKYPGASDDKYLVENHD